MGFANPITVNIPVDGRDIFYWAAISGERYPPTLANSFTKYSQLAGQNIYAVGDNTGTTSPSVVFSLISLAQGVRFVYGGAFANPQVNIVANASRTIVFQLMQSTTLTVTLPTQTTASPATVTVNWSVTSNGVAMGSGTLSGIRTKQIASAIWSAYLDTVTVIMFKDYTGAMYINGTLIMNIPSMLNSFLVNSNKLQPAVYEPNLNEAVAFSYLQVDRDTSGPLVAA